MNFSDNTFSLAKALHHINNAKIYFEDVKRDCASSTKDLFNSYIIKCDIIINSIDHKLTDKNRAILKKELADSFMIESINDKLIYLNEAQRNEVETFIDNFIKQNFNDDGSPIEKECECEYPEIDKYVKKIKCSNCKKRLKT